MGRTSCFVHEGGGGRHKLVLRLAEVSVQALPSKRRLRVTAVPTIEHGRLASAYIHVPEVAGVSGHNVMALVKRQLAALDDNLVCTATDGGLRVKNVEDPHALAQALQNYPAIEWIAMATGILTVTRGHRVTVGELPLPSLVGADGGMFEVHPGRHLYIPHLLTPRRFEPIFFKKDNEWQARVDYMHTDGSTWDKLGKAEMTVPGNTSHGLLWSDTGHKAVHLGTILLAVGVSRDQVRARLRGVPIDEVCAEEMTTRAWCSMGAATTTAARKYLSAGDWYSWQQAHLLPWLEDTHSKARFLLGLIAALASRIYSSTEHPEADNDLSQTVVRTPGDVLLMLARDATFRFMGAVGAAHLHHLVCAGDAAAWQAAFLRPSKAFTDATAAFYQHGHVGKQRDVAQEVPHDLSAIGRLAITGRVSVSHTVTSLLGQGEDEVTRRGLHPAELGYLCPAHVNSTADREHGGRARMLATGCCPTGPVPTSVVLPRFLACVRQAQGALQAALCQAIGAGERRLGLVVHSQLAAVLSCASLDVRCLRQWLFDAAGRQPALAEAFAETQPSVCVQSHWGLSLCPDVDYVITIDIQPGRLRKTALCHEATQCG